MTLFARANSKSTPITPIRPADLKSWLSKQPKDIQTYVTARGFKAGENKTLRIFDASGTLLNVLIGVSGDDMLYTYAKAATTLPMGTYHINASLNDHDATQAAIGWGLAQYKFDHYLKTKKTKFRKLVLPKNADKTKVESTIKATTLVRDLVNMPANDLGPKELSDAARSLAKEFNGKCKTDIVGEDLLKKNYPLVHAVGKASSRAPRLIDFSWGDPKAPKVTLVGKGVIFDNGGNNIKPGGSMAIMKKDMGGAAHVLGLARMIMENNVNVRLRVLIPAVENAIDGNAMRPGDIYPSRKGSTVEIENTDAEGRLILADALAEAAKENPDLLVDFATLTGAARTALGPDLPPFFTDSPELAAAIMAAGHNLQDPMWQLPLWDDYLKKMGGMGIADICHTATGRQGGAITAALFLKHFVEDSTKWVHIDTWAWRASSRPGRPKGGDAIGMRTMFATIQNRYGTSKKNLSKKTTPKKKAKAPKK